MMGITELLRQMKNKLYIYSEDVHDYVLLSYLDLISVSSKKPEIILLTYRNKIKRIENKIKILEDKMSIKLKILESMGKTKTNKFCSYLQKIFAKFPKYLLNSVYLFFNLLKIKSNDKVIITEIYNKIHAILFYFIIVKIKNNDNYILSVHNAEKFLVEGSVLNKLLIKSSSVIVFSEQVKFFLSKGYNKKIVVVPGALPSMLMVDKRTENLVYLKHKKIVFTVTGLVDQNRKNYKKIIDFFSEINSNDYKLIFLGKLITIGLKNYAKQKNVEAVFFEDYVDDNNFAEIILTSHFLLSLNSNGDYLKSKVSGITHDSLRYSVPLVSDNPTFANVNVKHILIKNHNQIRNLIFEMKDFEVYSLIAQEAMDLSRKAIPRNLVKHNTDIKNLFRN